MNYLEEEALRCEMAKAVRDFPNLDGFVSRLLDAGYAECEILLHGRDVWKRERMRQQLKHVRVS